MKIDEIVKAVQFASRIADDHEGRIGFDVVLDALKKIDVSKSTGTANEGPDPKVLQFLSILEEYRIKCEEEGNYLEAARAHKQLGVLRKQEEKRQQKVIQARHISEKQDVQLSHNMQFSDFNKQWDKYLQEYDAMAQMYIQQMTERHALVLLEFQKELREELAHKAPKWSRTLLDQRRKQHINARNKNYVMAQKLKKLSDTNEVKERKHMEEQQAIVFARRDAKFRIQQQTELQALLKRIEGRRKEHIKQRELDTKRLLQRNRNVQQVLESKQAAEQQKLFQEIKKILYSNEVLKNGGVVTNYNNNNNNNNSDSMMMSKSRGGSSFGGGGSNSPSMNNNNNNYYNNIVGGYKQSSSSSANPFNKPIGSAGGGGGNEDTNEDYIRGPNNFDPNQMFGDLHSNNNNSNHPNEMEQAEYDAMMMNNDQGEEEEGGFGDNHMYTNNEGGGAINAGNNNSTYEDDGFAEYV
jgi:hypothetical protein